MALPALRQFVLVGGTNLSLRLGHRISVDLDLFTNESWDTEWVFQQIQSHFSHIILGSQTDTMLFLYVQDVKVDMLLLPYPLIKPIDEIAGIRLASVPDIIAMKLSAVARRGVKKDFWDIAALLDEYDIAQMIGFYQAKYESRDIFHVIRSLVYFEDAENQKDPQRLKSTSWQEVKIKITSAVKQYVDRQI